MHVETGAAGIVYLAIVAIATLTSRFAMRTDGVLALPVGCVLLTFALYIVSLALHSPLLAISLAVALAFLLGGLSRDALPRLAAPVPRIALLVVGIASLLIVAPRLPIAWSSLFGDGSAFLAFTDEEKHLSVLISLMVDGKRPFPFDPTLRLPYYYFYYLLPAKVSALLPSADATFVWVLHVAVTQLAFLLAGLYMVCSLSTRNVVRVGGLLLLICGTSLKAIPNLMHWYGNARDHIEVWWAGQDLPPASHGWQITHPITAALWVPQHQFGALAAMLTAAVVLRGPVSWRHALPIGMFLSVMMGSSAFVGVAFGLGLGAFLIVRHRDWPLAPVVSLGGALAGLLSLAYLLQWGGGRASVYLLPSFAVAPGMPAVLGLPLYYVVELGPLPFVVLGLALGYVRRPGSVSPVFQLLALACLTPLVIARLFESSMFNDVGMRTQLLLTSFLPLLWVFLMQHVHQSRSPARSMGALLAIGLVFGLVAGLLEVGNWFPKIREIQSGWGPAYREVAVATSVDDIVVTNRSEFADRVPMTAHRLTLQPHTPFVMEIFLPEGHDTHDAFSADLCRAYEKLHRTPVPYGLVYLEVKAGPPASPCTTLEADKRFATILIENDTFALYRFEKNW